MMRRADWDTMPIGRRLTFAFVWTLIFFSLSSMLLGDSPVVGLIMLSIIFPAMAVIQVWIWNWYSADKPPLPGTQGIDQAAQAMAEGLVAPAPPIFVADREGVDVIVFETIEEAEGFIEPADVASDDVAFDGRGRRLSARLEGRRTRLSVSEESTDARNELVRRIRAFLQAIGTETPPPTGDWDLFVRLAARSIADWMRD